MRGPSPLLRCLAGVLVMSWWSIAGADSLTSLAQLQPTNVDVPAGTDGAAATGEEDSAANESAPAAPLPMDEEKEKGEAVAMLVPRSKDGAKVDLRKMAAKLNATASSLRAQADAHAESTQKHVHLHHEVASVHSKLTESIQRDSKLIDYLMERVDTTEIFETGLIPSMVADEQHCLCLTDAVPMQGFLASLGLERYEFQLAGEGFNSVKSLRHPAANFTDEYLARLTMLPIHRQVFLAELRKLRAVFLHVKLVEVVGLPGFVPGQRHAIRANWAGNVRETRMMAGRTFVFDGDGYELLFPAADVSLTQEGDPGGNVRLIVVKPGQAQKAKCTFTVHASSLPTTRQPPHSFPLEGCSGIVVASMWLSTPL